MCEVMSHDGPGLLPSGAHNSELAGYWHFNLYIDALKVVCLLKFARVLYPCTCKVCVAHQQQAIIAKSHSQLNL